MGFSHIPPTNDDAFSPKNAVVGLFPFQLLKPILPLLSLSLSLSLSLVRPSRSREKGRKTKMEVLYFVLFGALAVVVAGLELSKSGKDRISTSPAFNAFSNNYLLVYSIMMGTPFTLSSSSSLISRFSILGFPLQSFSFEISVDFLFPIAMADELFLFCMFGSSLASNLSRFYFPFFFFLFFSYFFFLPLVPFGCRENERIGFVSWLGLRWCWKVSFFSDVFPLVLICEINAS